LEATIRYHLKRDNFDVATMIYSNIYVDNVSVGTTLVEEAYNIFNEFKRVVLQL